MRRLASDLGWLVRNRYTMRGALEIDVTLPRQLIREHKARTGETISFTAYLTKCVAQAVELDKSIHAMRNWRGDLVVFDDVDIGTLIEREADGNKYPLAHIVRAANKKSLREVHDEVRRVQAQPMSDQEASSLDIPGQTAKIYPAQHVVGCLEEPAPAQTEYGHRLAFRGGYVWEQNRMGHGAELSQPELDRGQHRPKARRRRRAHRDLRIPLPYDRLRSRGDRRRARRTVCQTTVRSDRERLRSYP